MDIEGIVSTEYQEVPPDARTATLLGLFANSTVKGVVVTGAHGFEGVITRRQLATSRLAPAQKAGSLVWSVPQVAPDEDVREVARLMIDGDTRVLPVSEGDQLVGVVTGDDLIRAVEPFLDAATISDVVSSNLISMAPETTVGEALHRFREHRITHIPVVENGTAVGILSLYDLTWVTVRAPSRSQGGDAGGRTRSADKRPPAAGVHAVAGSVPERGELAQILDLPVQDVMVSSVRTIDPAATLDVAVDRMLEAGISSLVVNTDGNQPDGIVTKTDVLDVLTWEAEGQPRRSGVWRRPDGQLVVRPRGCDG